MWNKLLEKKRFLDFLKREIHFREKGLNQLNTNVISCCLFDACRGKKQIIWFRILLHASNL